MWPYYELSTVQKLDKRCTYKIDNPFSFKSQDLTHFSSKSRIADYVYLNLDVEKKTCNSSALTAHRAKFIEPVDPRSLIPSGKVNATKLNKQRIPRKTNDKTDSNSFSEDNSHQTPTKKVKPNLVNKAKVHHHDKNSEAEKLQNQNLFNNRYEFKKMKLKSRSKMETDYNVLSRVHQTSGNRSGWDKNFTLKKSFISFNNGRTSSINSLSSTNRDSANFKSLFNSSLPNNKAPSVNLQAELNKEGVQNYNETSTQNSIQTVVNNFNRLDNRFQVDSRVTQSNLINVLKSQQQSQSQTILTKQPNDPRLKNGRQILNDPRIKNSQIGNDPRIRNSCPASKDPRVKSNNLTVNDPKVSKRQPDSNGKSLSDNFLSFDIRANSNNSANFKTQVFIHNSVSSANKDSSTQLKNSTNPSNLNNLRNDLNNTQLNQSNLKDLNGLDPRLAKRSEIDSNSKPNNLRNERLTTPNVTNPDGIKIASIKDFLKIEEKKFSGKEINESKMIVRDINCERFEFEKPVIPEKKSRLEIFDPIKNESSEDEILLIDTEQKNNNYKDYDPTEVAHRLIGELNKLLD